MDYLALYRKYRPKTFDEIIGQDHIVKTLTNQIKNGQIGHAYLFCGSRGTGKTSTAKLFAKSINCESPINGSACGKCEVCKSNMEQNLDILEIDAASNNGVDEIRDLREQIKYPPVVGKYKVYIIDEVHMLSISAFNALLKTLEEPPKYVVFILATTEVHKLPATILSRCMRFDFRLIPTNQLVDLLKKILKDSKITFENDAVELIARVGEGSARDAISIADRVVSYAGDNLTYEATVQIIGSVEKEKLSKIAECFLQGDIGKVLVELDKILSDGKSPLLLSKDLVAYFTDLLLVLTVGDFAKKMIVVPEDVLNVMKSQATEENYNRIISAIERLSEVEQELRFSVKPKIVLETSLIKAIYSNNLEARIEKLEKKLLAISPEDKKKITTNNLAPTVESKIQKINNKNTINGNNADKVFGTILKGLRENSFMIVYSALATIDDYSLSDNLFEIRTDDESIFSCLNDTSNKSIIESFLPDKNILIKIIKKENLTELLKNKLLQEFGDKLKIKND